MYAGYIGSPKRGSVMLCSGFCDHLLNCAFQMGETVTVRGYPLTSTSIVELIRQLSRTTAPPDGHRWQQGQWPPCCTSGCRKAVPTQKPCVAAGALSSNSSRRLAVSVHRDSRTAPSLLPHGGWRARLGAVTEKSAVVTAVHISVSWKRDSKCYP